MTTALCPSPGHAYNMPMKVISLQSGSNGNCIYVEARGTSLLFDAGISGKRAKERLADCGRDIAKVDVVVVSHDHSDHIGCAGIYHRKLCEAMIRGIASQKKWDKGKVVTTDRLSYLGLERSVRHVCNLQETRG